MASNYFNTDQVLEMVLADGNDQGDGRSVEEDFGDLESESDFENCSFRSQVGSFSEGSIGSTFAAM